MLFSTMDATVLKKCDIVMKGGITSGVVYPSVVCNLAERYQFESIGGTSAGAIAASLTAAAEYARRNGRDVFKEVAKVPAWLGASSALGHDSNLFHLFQPQPGMEGLFRVATAFLIEGWLRRILSWCRVLWLEMLVGAVPGVALLCLSSNASGWRLAAAVGLGLLVALAGSVVAAILGVLLRVARLPGREYGLCTGYAGPREGSPVSLTAWLNERLNTLAGMPGGQPLTFGDLQGAGITLKMITTCLTFGCPFTLPFESKELYFSSSEMRRYFPEEVVAWMESHPAEPCQHSEPVDAGELRPLPDRDHLPVIFATRLSLSFPVLFCAVPLYAVDWTRRRRTAGEPAPPQRVPGDALAPDELRTPERVWFSDGGICSNFPLHLFDSPLPRWPTFGIDLRDLRPDRAPASGRVWMPESNRQGAAHLWTRLSTKPELGALGGLISTMFDAARSWMDNLQAAVPGYRDRVVHLYLDSREGGLNLNMPEDVVKSLGGYGQQAAGKLIDHFCNGLDSGQETPMTWNNHRWIRYRTTMALLEAFLAKFTQSIDHPESGDSTYFELVRRGEGDPPISYPLDVEQRPRAGELTQELKDLGNEMLDGTMQRGAPQPTPALRIRPTF
jgi:predicted acylesterase/phospholipase RssA